MVISMQIRFWKLFPYLQSVDMNYVTISGLELFFLEFGSYCDITRLKIIYCALKLFLLH